MEVPRVLPTGRQIGLLKKLQGGHQRRCSRLHRVCLKLIHSVALIAVGEDQEACRIDDRPALRRRLAYKLDCRDIEYGQRLLGIEVSDCFSDTVHGVLAMDSELTFDPPSHSRTGFVLQCGL